MLRNRILSACGILGFVAAIVVFDLGCPSGDSGSDDPKPVVSVSVSPNPASVRIGGTISLHATVYTTNNSVLQNHTVSWHSNDAAIATVSGNTGDATLTGVAVGSTTVTASAGNQTATITVTVSNIPVSSVTVSGPTTVAQAGTAQLTATAKDDQGNVLPNRTTTWSSSNPSIASVSSSGLVTGNVVGGPVTITATIELHDGSAPISVTATPIATITISGLATIPVGVGTQYSIVLKDAAGNVLPQTGRLITWTSSNPAVASVSGGDVSGISPGQATITASAEGKSGSATITVTAPVSLVGRVINYVNGAAIAGATVNFRRNDGGLGSIWGSTTSGADGSFTSPATSTDLSQGVQVEALATGFVTGRVLVANALVGGSTFVGDVPLVPTSAQPGGISGVIRNALTGAGISGASVQVFDNISSTSIQTQSSGANGTFAFTNLPAGTYRLDASATGFRIAQRTGVAVGNGGTTPDQDLVLSPSGTNTVTIVLTWGASPSDLDTHFTGPNADATPFHVYYASRGNLNSAPFAHLDLDDVTAFGPETVTLTQMNTGTYRYSVHDFSNRSSSSSSALGASGAKVQVYTTAGIQTFFVPAQPGTLWTVFELSGTLASPSVVPKNIMSFVGDPSAITAPAIDGGGLASDAWLIARATALHPKGRP